MLTGAAFPPSSYKTNLTTSHCKLLFISYFFSKIQISYALLRYCNLKTAPLEPNIHVVDLSCLAVVLFDIHFD